MSVKISKKETKTSGRSQEMVLSNKVPLQIWSMAQQNLDWKKMARKIGIKILKVVLQARASALMYQTTN